MALGTGQVTEDMQRGVSMWPLSVEWPRKASALLQLGWQGEAPCVESVWPASRQRGLQIQRFQGRDDLSAFRGHEGACLVEG